MDVADGELLTLLSEQRRELTAAIAADFDLDFAFQLQMQEAIKASSTSQPSSSSYSSQHPLLIVNDDADTPSGVAHLLAEEIDKFERERRDRELVEEETRKMRENLNRLIHDQVFARQILDVPEHEWRTTGEYFEKPYGLSPSSNEEVFRVYFKGLVSEETVMNAQMSFAGIGVAICDTSDCCVFELRKPFLLEGGGVGTGGDVVELNALIDALDAAVTLGLKRVHVFCDSNSLYQYLTGKWLPTENNIVTLVDQLNLIQRKFTYCGPFLVRQNKVRFAFQLARDAIVSQATKLAESTRGKAPMENCTICFEYIYSGQMFSVNSCLHRYCFSCMGKHVEATLRRGKLPECPHDGCKSELKIESCKKFLSPELYDIMSLRIKEASIPPTERVYCPFSSCSALMSQIKVQEYAATLSTAAREAGMRKCIQCHCSFCINCKVPWHDNITCSDYKKNFPYPSASEAKLKSLATRKHWRQCVKCKNLVELAEGCYHIYCRCGYEFCYTCGAEWKNKHPTCKCPIWDERNILYAEQNRHQQR